MNPYTPTLPELVEDLRTELMRFAMAVSNMRRLQREHEDQESLMSFAEMTWAEEEVDALAARFLLPSPL